MAISCISNLEYKLNYLCLFFSEIFNDSLIRVPLSNLYIEKKRERDIYVIILYYKAYAKYAVYTCSSISNHIMRSVYLIIQIYLMTIPGGK